MERERECVSKNNRVDKTYTTLTLTQCSQSSFGSDREPRPSLAYIVIGNNVVARISGLGFYRNVLISILMQSHDWALLSRMMTIPMF
jgi:hypothetical protein